MNLKDCPQTCYNYGIEIKFPYKNMFSPNGKIS